MPKFTYKARDSLNKKIAGTLEGASFDEVLVRLSDKGLIPLSLEELNFDGSPKNVSFLDTVNEFLRAYQTRVPYKSVVFFTRQLATMVNAGVPLSQALEQLASSEKAIFARTISAVAADISMGASFSEAISHHPGAFDKTYVAVVHSGEIAGALDRVLDELATYMENIHTLKEKVKGAMRYPAFIGGFVVILIVAILWKLVPVFERLYGNFGAQLPAPTKMLIAMSHTIQHYALLFVLGAIIVSVAYVFALRTPRIRAIADASVLKFPVFGEILRKNILARFSRTMSLLLGSGTPILSAVEVAGTVVGNKLYSDALDGVYKSLRTGELLSSGLKASGQFPVLVVQLVTTGESSGRIDDLLSRAAEFYEREIKVTVDSLAAIIEPFLIITLGAIVGAILIALYLPVFMMGKIMH